MKSILFYIISFIVIYSSYYCLKHRFLNQMAISIGLFSTPQQQIWDDPLAPSFELAIHCQAYCEGLKAQGLSVDIFPVDKDD